MARRFLNALIGLFCGYFLGAALTWALTMAFSGNRHDLELEAAMTAAFVGGPFCALIGLIVGAVRRPRPRKEG